MKAHACARSPVNKGARPHMLGFLAPLVGNVIAGLIPAAAFVTPTRNYAQLATPIQTNQVQLIGKLPQIISNRAVIQSHIQTPARNLQAMTTDASKQVKEFIDQNPVAMFSYTYCPYCVKAKGLLNSRVASPKIAVLEADLSSEKEGIKKALKDMTGRSTMPNIFIGGKNVGGCDDLMALHNKGGLDEMLKAANVDLKP